MSEVFTKFEGDFTKEVLSKVAELTKHNIDIIKSGKNTIILAQVFRIYLNTGNTSSNLEVVMMWNDKTNGFDVSLELKPIARSTQTKGEIR